MKFISLVLVCCLGFFTSAFADNRHIHPQANGADKKATAKGAMGVGFCEIEILNRSYDDIRVFGVFDDGTSMEPFSVYRYEGPHFIDLFYYGYCHAGMNLYINTFNGFPVYSGYIPVHSTVDLVPSFGKTLKAEIRAK